MKTNRYLYLLTMLLSVLHGMHGIAQGVCASSALAPVFKQTFGTSTSSTINTTVPSGFITNYAFNGTTSLVDGQYMVTPLVQNSQKNDWAVGGDHTGDVNGNMFLVNAGTGASLFFKQQVDNLCPGSTYSFSAWLANVNTISNTQPICNASYVYPNVTFYIKNTSGTILQFFNTGNLPYTINRLVAPNWLQYGFQFTLPAGTTSLVLEMADFYGGLPQCGNDLAIDDIVFSACTPQTTIAFNTASAVCAGTNTIMNSSLINSPFTSPAYQWQKSTDGGTTWNNIGTPGTSAVSFPLNNVTAADGAQYRVLVGPDVSSLSSNTCVSASNIITLIVNALPLLTIGSNSPVCVNGTVNLFSNPSGGPAPYSYNWTGPSFTSTQAAPSINNTTVVANGGMYELIVTDANGCVKAATTNVTITNPPTTANAGIDQLICNTNSVTLSANSPLIGTGLWTQTSGPTVVSFANAAQTNTSANGLTAGTYQFTWTISNNPCASSSDNVLITVYPSTVAGILSANAVVCAGSNNGSLLLTGNTGNILQWESSINNGLSWTVISNTNATYNYSNLSITTLLRVLVRSGNCAAQYSNTVSVTVNQLTVAGLVSSDAVVCTSLNNGTLFLTGYIGNILHWESSNNNGASWQTITNTNNTYSYQNIYTTTLYRALLQNGVCTSAYSNYATITTRNAVTPSNAGVDQILCNASNTVLSGNTPAEGKGIWSLISGPGVVVFSNDSGNNTNVSGLKNGVYQLGWRISNMVCPDTRDTVAISILTPLSNITDTNTQTVCKGQTVLVTGQVAIGGNGSYQYQWSISYDGVQWASGNNDTGMNYSFVADSNFLVRRIVVSSPCNSASAITKINVQQPLSDNIISGNQEICTGSFAKNITGNLPSGGDGNYNYQWQKSKDNGNTWSSINNATGKDLKPDTSLFVATLFRRMVTTQLCTGPLSSASNIIVVTMKPVSTVSVQYKGGVYCTLQNTIDFSPTTSNTDSIRWDFGDGNVITTTPQKMSHTYTTAGSFAPLLQLINTNTGCVLSVNAGDTIRIDEVKAGFKLSAVYNCGKTIYRFIDTSQSYFPIDNRSWNIDQSSTIAGKEYQQAFTTGGNHETVLQVITKYGCAGSLQAKFNVSIYNYPKADINAIGKACMNSLMELKSIVNSPDSVKSRYWNLGNGASSTDSVVKVYYYSAGKYIVQLTVATINSCYDSALKQINIHPPPTINVTADHTLCKGDSLVLAANGAIGYIWKDQNDNIVCADCATVKVIPQKNTQYKVIGYSEFGCTETAATNVRVIQPLKLNVKPADTICIGEKKQLFVSGAAVYAWQPDASLSSYNSSSPYISPLVNTTYHVIGKDGYNCFADTAEIKIIVGKPTAISVGRDTNILSGVPVQLHSSAALPDIRKWQWKGNATFSCINCSSPTAKVIMDECLNCTATNIYGCTSSDTVCITTFCLDAEVFIPNAFSPDGDGINDVLIVQGRGLKLIKSFRIFSRWGEMIFEKTNFLPGDRSAGWDGKIRGKAATPDVFVYICETVCERGIPAIFKGNVAILK